MKLMYFIGLMFGFGYVQAQTATENIKNRVIENTLLWEITGNGLAAPGYLFGTFHLLCADDVFFSQAVKNAIAGSKEIYLELDLDDPSVVIGGLGLMIMKNGKKLKDLYSPEVYQKLAVFFKDSLQTSLSVFQNMKPSFLVALLYPKMMSCAKTMSVEEGIMKLAKENDIPIQGLETMAFQASLLDSIPYEKQAEELLQAIDSMEKSKVYFRLMLDAYKKQHLNEIETIINDTAYGIGENQEILLDKRNKNWVVQLKEIMKKGSVFTAVGAGHLVGKNGLIALLRNEGYTVRGIDNNQ